MKYLICLLCLLGFNASAQKMADLGLNRTRIILPDKTILAEIKPVTSDPAFDPSVTYYWYSSNAIHSSQGSFSGKLLNGKYNEYYINQNLKEQGFFKKGLKDGTWKTWAENGNLITTITWKKGIKLGAFANYDERGNLKQAGYYRQNLLDGTIKNYHGTDSVEVVKYNHGKVVPKLTGPAFWQKINIFKKKKGAGTSVPKPVGKSRTASAKS